jgi:hypothetical protein
LHVRAEVGEVKMVMMDQLVDQLERMEMAIELLGN